MSLRMKLFWQTCLSSEASSRHSTCGPRTLFSSRTTWFFSFLCTLTLLLLSLHPSLLGFLHFLFHSDLHKDDDESQLHMCPVIFIYTASFVQLLCPVIINTTKIRTLSQGTRGKIALPKTVQTNLLKEMFLTAYYSWHLIPSVCVYHTSRFSFFFQELLW